MKTVKRDTLGKKEDEELKRNTSKHGFMSVPRKDNQGMLRHEATAVAAA